MKILIVGASGLVGSHLHRAAIDNGHEVTGTYRNCPVPGLLKLDMDCAGDVFTMVEELKPDWVVHAAGWTWVDGCEKDPQRAYRENCEQPAALAQCCKLRNTRFVYLSTTYIFDGVKGNYSETDEPNPINVYGRTKLAAETQIQEILGGEALIARLICVWGSEVQRKNFVYQAIKSLQEGKDLSLPADQVANPTWAGDIAFWLTMLMNRSQLGIWNLAGPELYLTRVEWFCRIRDAAIGLGLVPAESNRGYRAVLTSSLKQPAIRPLNASADISKIQTFQPRQLRFASDLDGINLFANQLQ